MDAMMDFSTPPSCEDVPKRSGRSSRRRAVPKLRDSCTGCAASKVRCTKEKPSCSRCARRGINCQYIVTRRTGRTSCRTSQPVNRVPPLLALRQPYLSDEGAFDDPFGSSSLGMSNPSIPDLTPSSSGHTSPAQQPQLDAYPDMVWRGVMSPPGSGMGEMPPAAYMSLAPEMDNLFDPNFSFTESPMTKTGEQQFGYFNNPEPFPNFAPAAAAAAVAPDFFPTSQPAPHHPGSVSTNSIPSLPAFSSPPSGPTARFGDLERTQSCGSHVDASSNKSCLDTAITHLTRLLSGTTAPGAAACRLSGAAPPPADSFSNIHTTVAENRQILESIPRALDCACCAHDDYTLVVQSLIVLKVLARYSAAARVRPAADHGFAWGGLEDPFGGCGADSAYTPSSSAGSVSSISSAGSSLFDDAFATSSSVSSASSMSSSGSSSSRKMSLAHQQQQENPNRPAAEKVLAELHRVREVIHLVCVRMRERAARGREAAARQKRGHAAAHHHRGLAGGAVEDGLLGALTRFPSAGFEQMEKDLQLRLREVSMEMIDILRRE